MKEIKENISIEEISMEKLIEKINYYTQVSRERELTEEEKIDRQKYRQVYLVRFKKQVVNHLEKITIVNEDGTLVN